MMYLFFLGRQSDLARAELEVVLARFGEHLELQDLANDIVTADLSEAFDASALMNTVGGVVKVAKTIAALPSSNTKNITKEMVTFLAENHKDKTGKVEFCLAEHGRNWADAVDAQEIKDELKKLGIPSRYREVSRSGAEAALLLHSDTIELHSVQHDGKTKIAQTVAVQDIDAWSKRDMRKPYRDPKKGMMPPKLARTMVNLAIGTRNPSDCTVYDPFCGTGTILMEAQLLGTKVIGSDIDKDAVMGTGRNLLWMTETYQTSPDYILSVQDVAQTSLQETKDLVDCIVTEPFLGKSGVKPPMVQNTIKGLEKLYLGMFKQWRKVIKKNGRVVVILPSFVMGNTVKTVQIVIDRLETLGYTRENGSFFYPRPGAIVQRNIYVLGIKE